MLRGSWTFCALFVLLVGALAARPAAASEEEDTEAARIHYKAGEQYYLRGHYTQAIGEFKEAYRLSKASALLYNISQAYERSGDLVNARDYLKRYMDSGETEQGELPALKEKLASLDKRIGKGETPGNPPPTNPPPIKPPPVIPPVTPPVETHEAARPLKTWKWVMTGTGAGLLVLSGLFALDGQKQEQRLEDSVVSPPNVTYTPEIDAIYKRGKRANTLAVVFGIGGVGLVATGVVFFILDAKDASAGAEAHARIVPVVGPGLAGASAVWRF